MEGGGILYEKGVIQKNSALYAMALEQTYCKNIKLSEPAVRLNNT
jgi:hypothetical protein